MGRLRVKFGREPTAGELEVSREESLRTALMSSLGREPTLAEIAAELEVKLRLEQLRSDQIWSDLTY